MVTRADLEKELHQAMRQGERLRRDTLRMALSAIKLAEVDRGRPLDADEVQSVLQKEAKSRRETISDAQKARRQDLIDAAEAELAVLEAFLPQPLSDVELESMAKKAIEAQGVAGPGDIGKVMGELMPKVAGRAEGKRVSRIVRQLLEGS